MGRVIKVNIGLNNNPISDIEKYFIENKGYKLLSFKTVMGEYNNEAEETAVIELYTDFAYLSKIVSDFECLCLFMTQECIAIDSETFSLLVYPVNFKGQRNKFNSDYFIN